MMLAADPTHPPGQCAAHVAANEAALLGLAQPQVANLHHRLVQVPQVAQQVVALEVKVHHVVQVQVLHAVRALHRHIGSQPLVVDALQICTGADSNTAVRQQQMCVTAIQQLLMTCSVTAVTGQRVHTLAYAHQTGACHALAVEPLKP